MGTILRGSICAWTLAAGAALLTTPLFGFQQAGPSPREVELEKRVDSLERVIDKLAGNQNGQSASIESLADQVNANGTASRGFSMPPELVPEIGKVGAQVGILLSGSSNPFHLDRGTYLGGFIDLPLIDHPKWLHGKIAYEILVGMSQSNTTMQTTSNVAQVANLAVLNALNPNGGLDNVTQAVTGTGSAPFPVTTSTVTRLRLLEVIPFSFKYTSTAFDRWRIRPYGLLGFGTYVTIHDQNPAGGNPPSYGVRPDANIPPDILAAVSQIYGGQAPFGGPLVAGQISQSPELEALGLPGGHGNIDFGYQVGLGFEYRVSRTFSIGLDNRYNKIAGAPGFLVTYGTRLGFHF